MYAESPVLCSCPLYSHAFLKLGLLGTGCHMQLSDAVSKLAAITESLLYTDLKHPTICHSDQEDTGRTCVLIILRAAFPGTLSVCTQDGGTVCLHALWDTSTDSSLCSSDKILGSLILPSVMSW